MDILIRPCLTPQEDHSSSDRSSIAGLQGNFRPVTDERTEHDLSIEGTLPDELNGVFVQSGPNPRFAPLGPYHLFDGDGMLHAVRLSAGRASYRNRYVRTRDWLAEDRAGCPLRGGLMCAPDAGSLAGSAPIFKQTANTATVVHHQRALALGEFGPPYRIALPDLETIGPYAIGRYPHLAFTAHPKIDPHTGELLYIRSRPTRRPHILYGVLNRHGHLEHETVIDTSRASLMHDFGMSSGYTVLIDQPLCFDLARARAGVAPWVCDLSQPLRFGVLTRYADGRDIRWLETSPCLITHTVNVHQDEAELVLLAVRYDRQPGFLCFDPAVTADQRVPEAPPFLHEWRINLRTGGIRDRRVNRRPLEYPRVNDAFLGHRVRYIYLVATFPRSGLVKYDCASETSTIRVHDRGCQGGEAAFVPRHGARAEDEGYLLTFVWDRVANRSALVVLDAHDLDAPPLARVQIPARVPFGFHTTFVPQCQLEGLIA